MSVFVLLFCMVCCLLGVGCFVVWVFLCWCGFVVLFVDCVVLIWVLVMFVSFVVVVVCLSFVGWFTWFGFCFVLFSGLL